MTEAPQKSGKSPVEVDRRSIKSVLINRPLQREFTLTTIAIMMVSAVFVSFTIHLTLRESIISAVGRTGHIGAYNMLSDVSTELIFRVIILFFITVITVGMFGIFFLHRVAGPAYRFQKLFKQIQKNEIPVDVTLREKDFFKEIALDMNIVFKLLRDRKTAIEKISSILVSISEQEISPDSRRKLQEIQSIIKEFHP